MGKPRNWATLSLLRVKLAVQAVIYGQLDNTKKEDYRQEHFHEDSELPTTHRPPMLRTVSTGARGVTSSSSSIPIPMQYPKVGQTRRNGMVSPTKSMHGLPHFHRRASSSASRHRPSTLMLFMLGVFMLGVFMSTALLVAAYFAPFWASAAAIPVKGTTSSYTIVLMSYTPRFSMLRGAIRHYSRCPSAAGVVVVWNKGPPLDPKLLPSAVPVRVRAEATNSLNNRFRPDGEIATRAVFSVDDDIRIPCTDVEMAFAAWRKDPEVMVGFYPRLIQRVDGKLIPSNTAAAAELELEFRGEVDVVRIQQYNTVLTGAAFLDASVAFAKYWASEVAAARQAVDDVFNGEDVLMNFVLSNATVPGRPAVRFLRPTRRLDISKFSSVGISHDMKQFENSASDYLKVFVDVFKGSPLLMQNYRVALGGRIQPLFCGTFIGCLYL